MAYNARVKVSIATTDGEPLEAFIVLDDSACVDTAAAFAAKVRYYLARRFDLEPLTVDDSFCEKGGR